MHLSNSVQSIINFIFNRYDYFHIPHPVMDHVDFANPIEYYFDLRPKVHYSGDLDDQGVFLLRHIKSENIYYPISIFNYGLAAFQNLQTNNDENMFKILKAQGQWAVLNQVQEGPFKGAWRHPYDWPKFQLKEGWVSAMAQGLGISFLTRLFLLTKVDAYRYAAEIAMDPFLKMVADGGVKSEHNGIVIYEEYPSVPPSCVLNGFITAILGLRDLAVLFNHQLAGKLWEDGLNSLIRLLPHYDVGYWSRYDLYRDGKNIASPFYHQYHISQLKLLYMITKIDIFNTYADIFENYNKSRINRLRAVLKKIIWKASKF